MAAIARRALALVSALLAGAGAVEAQGSASDSTAFFRAMELESAGKYREAAPLFRASLAGENRISAFLGLERVYAELGWADSILAPLDSLIARDPAESIFRVAQLRTYMSLGREAEVQRSFGRWRDAAPRDAAPYREYAKLLIQRGKSTTADSVVREARRTLGSLQGLEIENAQVRAAAGDWVESATAWRAGLVDAPYMDGAAAYALSRTPPATRPEIRRILMESPPEVAARKTLAQLEWGWGAPSDGWVALRGLTPDSAAVDAWVEFAQQAMAEERWALAYEAFRQSLKVRPTAQLAARTAAAAIEAGDAEAVLTIAPLPSDGDSATMARTLVPLHARALAVLGRPAEAERLVASFDRFIPPGPRNALTRTIALGWVRRGDMAQARAALAAAGPEADSSDTAGWLALYEGDLRTARTLLRLGTESTPELAVALGAIARVKAERSMELGGAFLALARGDSALAATSFITAAKALPEAASLLLLYAARLHAGSGRDAEALQLFARVVGDHGASPEAAQADLDWARLLRRKGDARGAVARLEHLILTYPESALVPQARRELDLARAGIPGGS